MKRTVLNSLFGIGILSSCLITVTALLLNELLTKKLILGGAVVIVELFCVVYGYLYIFQLIREDKEKIKGGILK